MSKSAHTLSGQSRGKRALSIVFAVISVVYLMPIFIVLMNAFKSNSAVNMDTFAFPNSETFMGWQNFIKGMTFGNYPFPKAVLFSFFITLVSAGLILLCCSMAAWISSSTRRKAAMCANSQMTSGSCHVWRDRNMSDPISSHSSSSGYRSFSWARVSEV